MRRADRLFEIIQQLRGDRLVTAKALAGQLEVSIRTVYRDIRDLQASGVPIDGAAGVGYLLRPGYHLPPLMFLPVEIEALIVGARMVKAWAGRDLAAAAAEALVKIGAVVPADRMRIAQRVPIFATGLRIGEDERRNLDLLAKAIDERRRTRFAYRDADGGQTDRTVWPLALHFWGQVWTLAAWCELRADFRTFRIDRAECVALRDDSYPQEKGRTLGDYLARVTRAP
ncbi:MAG: YafY family transcriptional regulator [Bauldia sp.]|nr:MAG: YafY family transcriptional regulator [Bauldia sp.]MBZ0226953.1 YafY family transcriptional regulator [Bauldia sp.]